jgi:hypothetical protein
MQHNIMLNGITFVFLFSRYTVSLTEHGVEVGNALKNCINVLASEKNISLPHGDTLTEPFCMEMVFQHSVFDPVGKPPPVTVARPKSIMEVIKGTVWF